jgi:hypothetical protein
MIWIIVCIGRCTIALSALGHWLVVDAGCVALAGALLRCARLLREAVARGALWRIGALVSVAEIFLDRISVFIELNYLRPNCELSIPVDKSNIKSNCYLSMNK